jgi:eukaryotic-like serine/threonine-protein kinase
VPIVGDVVGERYRIDAVLGFGGMASVFRATDLRLHREVAVKVLAANLAADPAFAERFDREARTMAGFSHPNLVAVYDVEPGDPGTGREPLYVMEYCPEGSLADRLVADGRIPAQELATTIGSVADGLDELHRAGFIHRDVKPHNILFAGGRAKLADFGVAKGDSSETGLSLTGPGSIVGTWSFLAPELIAGDPASVASDVYALGVTAFLGLTGRYPGASVPLVQTGDVSTVSATAPELGNAFDSTLARALDEDPDARPSPREFANQLSAAAGQPVGPGLAAAADASPAVTPVIDPEARTIVAGPVHDAAPPLRPAAPPSVPPAPAPPPGTPTVGAAARPFRPWRIAAVIVAVALLLLVAVSAVPMLTSGPGASPTPTARPASASPGVAQPVLAAIDRVDAAIDAARGGKDGLNGRDANELAQLAASVRTAVERGALEAARTAANTLADRARALSAGLDPDRRQAMVDAVDALVKLL